VDYLFTIQKEKKDQVFMQKQNIQEVKVLKIMSNDTEAKEDNASKNKTKHKRVQKRCQR